MNERNYFCASNTGDGFVNFFDNILRPYEKSFRYVIKGGSGTGKSTFMRKLAERFKKKCEKIEYFYCSGDTSSLDGVNFVNENICIIDGTAPHTADASVPMVRDKIVNVGEFIGEGVFSDEDKILDIISKKKSIYADLYSYTACCKEVYKVIKNENSFKSEKAKREYYLKEFELFKGDFGYERKLFLNCFDENGITDFIEKNEYKTIRKVVLNLSDYCIFMRELRQKLLKNGNLITVFHSVYNPSDIFAILIDGVDELIIRDESYFLSENDLFLKELTLKACSELKKAKAEHKKLEEFYVKRMDFEGLNGLYEKTVTEIERRMNLLKGETQKN